MSSLSPARRFAHTVLMEAERSGGFVREVAEHAPRRPSDPRDAALGLRLALGATAASGCLDELLNRFLVRPGRVKRPVRLALRIAAFELVYLGRAPEVAVSQGVELVRAQAPVAAGLANAVLRRVAAATAEYRAAEDVPLKERARTAQARQAGLPVWLVRMIADSCGADAAAALCAAQLEPAPMALQENPLRAGGGSGASLSAAADDGVADASLQPGVALPGVALVAERVARALPGCALPPDPAAYIASGALAAGDAVASDAVAQLIATAATAPGSCLEIGAGRGTKTFIMAAQAQRAGFVGRRHVAAELSAGKAARNRDRLEQAGLADGIAFACGDCRNLDTVLADVDRSAGSRAYFDTVFVDAPCSGTGTMRRHPEIPWRLTEADCTTALPELQLQLLTAAAARVATGGQLFYATCSILSSEDADVVRSFLASSAGAAFSLAPVSDAPIFQQRDFALAGALVQEHEGEGGLFRTVPALQCTDGHFCARFIRASA